MNQSLIDITQPPQSLLPGGLRREDFTALSLRGWEQPYTDYLYSMAWFEGKLYCGTMRGSLIFIKLRNPPPQLTVYPVPSPENPFSLDIRSQIWCYTPETQSWQMVFQSPMVMGRFGEPVPREVGYRGMAVFQGKSDPKPVLYVSTLSPARSTGPLILRSEDGKTFEPATDSGLGLGLEGLKSFRFLEIFKGKLYTSPIGGAQKSLDSGKFANSVVNSSSSPVVYESEDPAQGKWRPVSAPKFGSANNTVVFYATAFNDHFYASTFNVISGFQIWKTRGEGEAPYDWKNVLRLGAYRGKFNQGVIWMCPFKGALYACTGIQDGGYDRNNKIGPAAGEVIRIYPDDTWDLVVGTARLTPQGLKTPTSGMKPGFNNFFNGYLWQMAVYEDWLYLGTMDWSVYLRYAPVENWPPIFRNLFVDSQGGVEAVIAKEGGCDLWRTQDGDHWYPVTVTGFENPYNCGIRKLLTTPLGLAVGTVNPFSPTVAEKVNGQWQYVPNPRGGVEVWLGRSLSSASLPQSPSRSGPSTSQIRLTLSPESSLTPIKGALLPLAPSSLVVKPTYDRTQRGDPTPYQLSRRQLRSLKSRLNLTAAAPEILDFALDYHSLSLKGVEHLPKQGPVVFAANHTGTPILAGETLMLEGILLITHALYRQRQRAPRPLMGLHYYQDPTSFYLNRDLFERLGCIPITLENGIRLLDLGEDILICPEGEDSKPPYQMRPFFWGFAKMAWTAEVPIVPVVLIGPHESRLRIDPKTAPIVFTTPGRTPNPVPYQLTFMPPVNVRHFVKRLTDELALSEFCEQLRQSMQAVLQAESAGRPLIEVARRIQQRYGSD